jgi:hypothetical protein
LLKLTSRIIGLEFDLLALVGASEKKVYNAISISYIIVLMLAAISGSYLFYMIDDLWFSIGLGFFVFLFLFGAIFRVILVTNRDSVLDSNSSQSKLRKLLPTSSSLLRLLIGSIFALVLAFPLAAAVNHKLVLRISEAKMSEVKSKVESNAQIISIDSLYEDIKHTHFPLAVFDELVESGKIIPWIILVYGIVVYQQILLGRARNRKGFIYQALARQHYIEIIVQDYHETLEYGFSYAEKKYGVNLSKEREILDLDDFYPPFKVIPSPVASEHKEDEILLKKILGI